MKQPVEDCLPCESPGISAFGFRIGISLAFAGQGMVFGLGYNNALAVGEAPGTDSILYWVLHGALFGSSLAVVLLLGGPLFRETMETIRRRTISVEALFVLSAAGALVGSLVSSIRGEGSVYYEVISIVLCVYAIGKQIGVVQKGRVGMALQAFRQSFDTAIVLSPDGDRSPKDVLDLLPGEQVAIGPGEPIPVDGEIIKGDGYVRETSLTGEPSPVRKEIGDQVMAGTWSVDGNLVIVPRVGEPRTIDRILRVIEKAPASPSRLQETADVLMQWFVPFVCLVSAGTFTGWLFLGDTPWWNALFNAMAVLLVACPCALGLALPAGIWAGLYHLGQNGIVGRHGQLIDNLAECTAVAFDKTGTLSQFELGAEVNPSPDWEDTKAVLLQYVASLGLESPHPVSNALGKLSERTFPVRQFHVYSGLGLGGRVDGRDILAGEPALLKQNRIDFDTGRFQGEGKTVCLAVDGEFAGTVVLTEELRPESEDTLAVLQEMGLRCTILSGDPSPSREKIGDIDVQSGLSPAEKARIIKDLAKSGDRILFIGDGINDLPAMQASHSSLGIELGAALATEFSDGILLGGRVGGLPTAIHFARRIKSTLRGNLYFALGYNLIGMTLAAAGALHPVVAALLMVGSSVLVSFRAVRSASASR